MFYNKVNDELEILFTNKNLLKLFNTDIIPATQNITSNVIEVLLYTPFTF